MYVHYLLHYKGNVENVKMMENTSSMSTEHAWGEQLLDQTIIKPQHSEARCKAETSTLLLSEIVRHRHNPFAY